MIFNCLKATALLLFVNLLNGCVIANGPLEYATNKETDKVGYLPIGIPFFFGGHGSSVPITDELSLTAKHVALIDYSDVIAYHPQCDIAIIRQNNQNKTKATLAKLFQKQKISTVGWGTLGRVVKDEGKYFIDVNIVNNNSYKNCLASITNASVQSGMSGGGVFNNNDELVGIITGLAGRDFRLLDDTQQLKTRKISLFISVYYLKDWIFDVLKDFYQKPIEEISFEHNFYEFNIESI